MKKWLSKIINNVWIIPFLAIFGMLFSIFLAFLSEFITDMEFAKYVKDISGVFPLFFWGFFGLHLIFRKKFSFYFFEVKGSPVVIFGWIWIAFVWGFFLFLITR